MWPLQRNSMLYKSHGTKPQKSVLVPGGDATKQETHHSSIEKEESIGCNPVLLCDSQLSVVSLQTGSGGCQQEVQPWDALALEPHTVQCAVHSVSSVINAQLCYNSYNN